MSTAPTYRWNTSDFAAGYDGTAQIIHPHYLEIQDEILRLLSVHEIAPRTIVDLGGGSGRLIQRILDRWPQAHGIVVDQSEPFLALAERRLARFGDRANCVLSRLQADWSSQLGGDVTAVVSMSAIHHLDPAEKASLYRRCFDVLAPGGLLLNGDEVRAPDDSDYMKRLTAWADHMRRSMTGGAIPATFHDAMNGWIDRNVARFGQPKKSGDDCHETIDAQLNYFRAAGFPSADCPWQRDLWAVLRGLKLPADSSSASDATIAR
jgi:tRNA (cmo5U34)-methyltransferase